MVSGGFGWFRVLVTTNIVAMLRRMVHTCPNKVFVFLKTQFIEEKQLKYNKRSHSTKGEIII